ncbi:unnamed protein product [Urochloa decumbens]|uniref:DUF4220 domain-containing protein n=1 Tax=Urochloa decumbens TaxID=240449 RepID=A0ABC9D7B2_9POAL
MVMELSSAMDWWDEWKLRILVLGSTIIQFFLFFYGGIRRYRVPPWFRLCIWLAYLGGDSLAIYALATLFNRHKGEAPVQSTLEVLWAPILLVHLAGPEQITVYSVQDNELWRRHIVTLVSQVTVALYVFCVSWSGETSLLVAGILIFFIGIYKFSTKPWALKRATIDNLGGSLNSVPRKKKLIGSSGRWAGLLSAWTKSLVDHVMVCLLSISVVAEERRKRKQSNPRKAATRSEEGNVEDEASKAEAMEEADEGKELQEMEEQDVPNNIKRHMYLEYDRMEEIQLHNYVEEARNIVTTASQVERHPVPRRLSNLVIQTKYFVADQLVSYSRRLMTLRFMLSTVSYSQKNKMVAAGSTSTTAGDCERVENGIMDVYILLYTRVNVAVSRIGYLFRFITFSLAIATIGLFNRSNKDGYPKDDVVVTRILLHCILVLELLSFFNICLIFSPLRLWPASSMLNKMVSQQSIMACAARRKRPTWLLSLAALVRCDAYLNQQWYITQTPAYDRIMAAVVDHVMAGWREFIHDQDSYMCFNSLRGQWAIDSKVGRQEIEEVHKILLDVLRGSIATSFDQSVLLWHIATEICFHCRSGGGDITAAQQLSLEISGYMMKLLSTRPEMLMLGSRQKIFSIALDDIEFMARHGEIAGSDAQGQRELARGILRTVQHPWVYDNCVGPLIPGACDIAVALMGLQLEEKDMWDMVQGVWVEMLCYSASRCHGYLHARSIGEGGETLTRVWLLLCYLGMETVTDRLQRTTVPRSKTSRGARSRMEQQGEELV